MKCNDRRDARPAVSVLLSHVGSGINTILTVCGGPIHRVRLVGLIGGCCLICAICLSLSAAATAVGQTPPDSGTQDTTRRPAAAKREIPAWLTCTVLDDLDSDNLATRDAAWQRIVDAPDISHAEVLDTLVSRRDTLSPEQQDRLLDAAETRYLQRLAVIGIQMKTGVVPITIDKVFPDAPAADVLQINDQLLAINHVELPEDRGGSVLQATITALEAGEMVTLDIVRDGKPMLVDVVLANAFSLENFTTQQLASNRKRHWAGVVKDIRPMPIRVATKPITLVPNLNAGGRHRSDR
ncbi:MAG: PDZ domain-containing protein [Planctomycetes bacterium]|nr:PDZ domain-containing protein [Planctomycetota bacterium]NOG54752.1 PDZ domain-containing protein [Planctomycetota bacterium]